MKLEMFKSRPQINENEKIDELIALCQAFFEREDLVTRAQNYISNSKDRDSISDLYGVVSQYFSEYFHAKGMGRPLYVMLAIRAIGRAMVLDKEFNADTLRASLAGNVDFRGNEPVGIGESVIIRPK
jgi:hypothetical protein